VGNAEKNNLGDDFVQQLSEYATQIKQAFAMVMSLTTKLNTFFVTRSIAIKANPPVFYLGHMVKWHIGLLLTGRIIHLGYKLGLGLLSNLLLYNFIIFWDTDSV